MTGYAVGLPHYTAQGGGIVWFGGGKLAADLPLPKLRRRWAGSGTQHGAALGRTVPAGAAWAVLRNTVTAAADEVRDEAGFFGRCALRRRAPGVTRAAIRASVIRRGSTRPTEATSQHLVKWPLTCSYSVVIVSTDGFSAHYWAPGGRAGR